MYKGSMTKIADAALTTQHLLVKVGSDADHIAVMAAVTDVPVGTCDDTPALGESAAVRLLGSYPGTITMVASEAVSAGEQVFADAAGKVNDLPAAAATYFCVGTALTAASDDGDEIEVDACIPYPVVVTG